MSSWSGDLPRPADFNAYAPEAQRLILSMVERRFELEARTADAKMELDRREAERLDRLADQMASQSRTGLVLSAVLDVSMVAGIVLSACVAKDFGTAAVLAGLLGVVNLIPSLFKGRVPWKQNASPQGKDGAGK